MSLCPPGWYAAAGGCCRDFGGGLAECDIGNGYPDSGVAEAGIFDGGAYDGGAYDGGAFDTGAPDAEIFDGGAFEPDAGYEDAGAPPTICDYPCPAGWQRAQGAPDVCCREDGPNELQCFSQATGTMPSADGGAFDAGPEAGFADAGAACGPDMFWDGGCLPCAAADAGVGGCSTARVINDRCYAIDCASGSCSCVVDDVGLQTIPVPSNTCTDQATFQQLWSAGCNFPP